MFSLDELKQTRYFQDVFEEGRQQGLQEVRQERFQKGIIECKLKCVSRLLALGLTGEQIAAALDLPIEKVRETELRNS